MTIDGSDSSPKGTAPTLVVGDMKTWVREGRDLPVIDGYHFIDIAQLTPAFMRKLAPDIVLSALVGSNFDAVEIARKLEQMDFAGFYRVITQNVPDLDLVIAEVRNIAPLLDVDVIDLKDIFPEA